MDPIGYWCGKPISEMPREELLEIIKVMGEMQRNELAMQAREHGFLMAFAEARRSLNTKG